MALLRGGDSLWDAATPSTDDASAIGLVGPGPYVAIYIEASGAAMTFKLQVAVAPDGAIAAGRNAIDDDQDGGGLDWYDYDGSTTLSVGDGDAVAYDLSPFGPPLLRLVRTDTNGAATVTALMSSFGGD